MCDLQAAGLLSTSLIVGRRVNMDMKKVVNNSLLLSANIEYAAKQFGSLFGANAEDYFFIRRNQFPWHRIPNLAIGRTAYDNFVVGIAIKNNVSVIDASKTVIALHQTDHEGNKAGHRNPETGVNTKVIGYFNSKSGYTTSSQYYTDFVDTKTNDSTAEIAVGYTRTVGLYRRSVSSVKIAR